MVKKFAAVLLIGVMSIALLTACAGGNDTADASASTVGEQLTEENYNTWTKKEWDAASDAEKTAAARYVLFEVGDSMMDGFSDLVEKAKNDTAAQEKLDDSAEELKESISTILNSDETATIGEIVEASQQLAAQIAQ